MKTNEQLHTQLSRLAHIVERLVVVVNTINKYHSEPDIPIPSGELRDIHTLVEAVKKDLRERYKSI